MTILTRYPQLRVVFAQHCILPSKRRGVSVVLRGESKSEGGPKRYQSETVRILKDLVELIILSVWRHHQSI